MSVIQSGERRFVFSCSRRRTPGVGLARGGPEERWKKTRCDLNIAYPEPASGKVARGRGRRSAWAACEVASIGHDGPSTVLAAGLAARVSAATR
jgi:hypothetical protein